MGRMHNKARHVLERNIIALYLDVLVSQNTLCWKRYVVLEEMSNSDGGEHNVDNIRVIHCVLHLIWVTSWPWWGACHEEYNDSVALT